MALLILAFAALLNAAAFLGLRHLVGSGQGLLDVQALLGVRLRTSRASLARRWAFTLVGPAGCYVSAGWLLALAALIGGKPTTDESSMRVSVALEGPAASAGFKDGDRIVSVDSEPVSDWSHLKATVGKHRGEKVDVVVDRDGQKLVLSPVPRATDGKIYVGPYTHTEPVGFGEALAISLTEPASINLVALRTWLRVASYGEKEVEVMGPVGMFKATRKASVEVASGLRTVGVMNAYFLWLPALLALALFPHVPKRALAHPAER